MKCFSLTFHYQAIKCDGHQLLNRYFYNIYPLNNIVIYCISILEGFLVVVMFMSLLV